MKIGPNQLPPILSRALGSKRGLRWQLLVFISLYGLLVFNPALLPGFVTLLNRLNCLDGGTLEIGRESVSVPRPTAPTLGPPFLVVQPPKRLICLAPTTSAPPPSQQASALVLALDFRPLTLDTIICWEAHER